MELEKIDEIEKATWFSFGWRDRHCGYFEASAALIAGGDVVSTIKKGIIDPANINDTDVFIWLMMAALLAALLFFMIRGMMLP